MDIMTQLVGLASAIKMMHKQNYRHGDLKPENILVFTNGTNVGVWKIADLGLAKFHHKATNQRLVPTSMIGAGTVSYGPPEPITNSDSPRSRLYDIWSMGCIILQLVICLLYGDRALADLNKKTEAPTFDRQSSYWQGNSNMFRWNNIKVHDQVLKFVKKLEKDFGSDKSSSAGACALVELARLVVERLLVVKLPPERGKSARSVCRANADETHFELNQIKKRLTEKLRTHHAPVARQDHAQSRLSNETFSSKEAIDNRLAFGVSTRVVFNDQSYPSNDAYSLEQAVNTDVAAAASVSDEHDVQKPPWDETSPSQKGMTDNFGEGSSPSEVQKMQKSSSNEAIPLEKGIDDDVAEVASVSDVQKLQKSLANVTPPSETGMDGNFAEGVLISDMQKMQEFPWNETIPSEKGVDDDVAPSWSDDDVPSMTSDSTLSSFGLLLNKSEFTDELVHILLQDNELRALFSTRRVPPDKLERKYVSIFRQFSEDLRQEATNRNELAFVRFVKRKARSISYTIVSALDPTRNDGMSLLEKLSQQHEQRQQTLEYYLQSFEVPGNAAESTASVETKPENLPLEDSPPVDVDDSLSDDEEHGGLPVLSQMKQFFMKSQAFETLQMRLKEVLDLGRKAQLELGQGSEQEPNPTHLPGAHDLRRYSMGERLSAIESWLGNILGFVGIGQTTVSFLTHLIINSILRPKIPPGHRRITWVCVSHLSLKSSSRAQVYSVSSDPNEVF